MNCYVPHHKAVRISATDGIISVFLQDADYSISDLNLTNRIYDNALNDALCLINNPAAPTAVPMII
jgi:hypothetical protein